MVEFPADAPASLREALHGEEADFVVRAERPLPKWQVGTSYGSGLLGAVIGLLVLAYLARRVLSGEVAPANAILGVLADLVLIAASSARFALVFIESRAGPAWFALTPKAIVRARGGEVVRLEWSGFRAASPTVVSRGIGNVVLYRPTYFFGNMPRRVAGEGGRVRLWNVRAHRTGLYLVGIANPRAVAAFAESRIRAARAGRSRWFE